MTPAMRMAFKPGTLEAQLAASIDTTIAAAIRGYLPAVQAVIDGAVQVQRSELNEAMWMSIDSLPPCGPTAVYLGPGDITSYGLLFAGLGTLVGGFVFAAWTTFGK